MSGLAQIIGNPRAAFTRNEAKLVEGLGSHYDMNLQMQIIGPNQEFTIYLHTIVRSILTLSRQVLEEQCILNMKLGATDFMPRQEYQPDYAYMRALNINFIHPFQTFAQLDGVAESFRLQLCTTSSEGLVVSISDTVV